MTNEMKLLTALCDALGFDVARVCVNQGDVDLSNSMMRAALAASSSAMFGARIAGNEIKPIYEYKLTKRVDG